MASTNPTIFSLSYSLTLLFLGPPLYEATNRSTSNTNDMSIPSSPIRRQETASLNSRQSNNNIKKQIHMTDQMAAAIELSVSPNVPLAPAAGMYWSRAITYGKSPTRPLRAHTANLIGEYLYVFGGCDMKHCFNTLYILDLGKKRW
jgi:hypothetical protein